jgi:hypothetical protein
LYVNSYAWKGHPPLITARVGESNDAVHQSHSENDMGKYFLAWLLGVPAGLLVIVYLIMHH